MAFCSQMKDQQTARREEKKRKNNVLTLSFSVFLSLSISLSLSLSLLYSSYYSILTIFEISHASTKYTLNQLQPPRSDQSIISSSLRNVAGWCPWRWDARRPPCRTWRRRRLWGGRGGA